jgi:uncharacterized membrane protein YagU involved in acid resistance
VNVNWGSWLFWGFASTLLLETILIGSQGLGLTRMNLPYMLGTMFTTDREKARIYGFFFHLTNGWAFSLLYVLAFTFMNAASWWRGAVIGLLHGLFVLVVVVSLLPAIHPHMASEQHGPTATRELEPPGFLALNYGMRTPISVLVAHTIFGAMLGAFYHLAAH